ncbi:MATE family efflux transporter [Clostridium polynesiense]|uniref:MATE family efflux transporter n=1 Tax=Clostridium polynesiense TaxID=1325933 RepID=UPI000AAB2D92|nr:MATE family efflux transporter [Clostridium polynesiense]
MNTEKGKIIDKGFYNKLFLIAVPIVIQNFIASALNTVDTVMIGAVGEVEIASVGIANQFFFLFTIILFGITSGCAVFISQFWGKKDIKNIKRVLGLQLIISVFIALVFTLAAVIFPQGIISIFNKDGNVVTSGSQYIVIVAFSYAFTAVTFSYAASLRGIENSKIPMLVSAFALICNTFLNWVFIFGNLGSPAMGVQGAALATLIARILEAVLMIYYVYHIRSPLAAKFKELIDLTSEFSLKILKKGLPVLLNESCWGLGIVMYNIVYGRIGAQATAAMQINNTITNLFMVVIFGVSNACMVIIGNRVGAQEYESARSYSRKFIKLSIVIGVLIAAGISLFAPFILSFFNISQLVYDYTRNILYITAAVMCFRTFNLVMIVGILRGGGDTKAAFYIEASTMWFIGVPLSMIAAFILGMPVYAVAALSMLEEIAKAILGYYRFRSGKWINNLVHNM